MSCSYYNRRRPLLVSAALAYAAVITSSSTQAAATTQTVLSTKTLPSSRPSSHTNNYQSSSDDEESTLMVPTFSCGSHWQSATQCNQLCVDGSDTSCPIGQHCYAGIPCSKSSVEKSALQMEKELMERLIWKRDNESGDKGFVCGTTFQEAESSCGSSVGGGGPVHYCNSGQSSECPSNMECFASVACSSSGTGSTSSPSSFVSGASLTSAPKEQPVISFSSPTANVTPILHQEEDDASFSYYSLNNIVDTMGSKLISSLGALSHSEC
mmetsp:Transcript_19246/g.31599  ORF Transcript_19246/g.31599 Transcript_19246/m.31599 type:complete len:268 (+) Transcript_19246:152-955(+)